MKKIYAAAAIVFGAIIAVFTAFIAGGRSKENEIKAEAEAIAREYENAGSDAIIGGLEKERGVRSEKVDSTTRDYDPN